MKLARGAINKCSYVTWEDRDGFWFKRLTLKTQNSRISNTWRCINPQNCIEANSFYWQNQADFVSAGYKFHDPPSPRLLLNQTYNVFFLLARLVPFCKVPNELTAYSALLKVRSLKSVATQLVHNHLQKSWIEAHFTKCSNLSGKGIFCVIHAKDWCPKFATDKRPLSSLLFVKHSYILYKTEVQTVILRCWMGLNLNWFKGYDIKRKRGGY